MPKMKTKRAAAKRFKKTKSGLFKRSKAYRGHQSACKSTKRQRQLRKNTYASTADQKRVERLMPNA